jgi:hypothetical protein
MLKVFTAISWYIEVFKGDTRCKMARAVQPILSFASGLLPVQEAMASQLTSPTSQQGYRHYLTAFMSAPLSMRAMAVSV